jgi:hypothetical protein
MSKGENSDSRIIIKLSPIIMEGKIRVLDAIDLCS